MKLLYLWVENHRDIIKNQSLNISSSYHIDFDIEFNKLHVSKNKEYIENFYGNNVLDITAIVGKNGTGKTTITRSLYEICNGVNLVNNETGCPDDNTKHIVIVYEEEPNRLIIQYCLCNHLKIETTEDMIIDLINLKDIEGEEFVEADKQHDITTVYFTNAFEINNVLDNQGFSEFSSWGTHKSLAYTPMLSLNRAFLKLKEHYGAKQSEGGLIISNIEQYAKNMTRDFKLSYATSQSYNYLIATRYFPGAIVSILPVMRDFKISITEFGRYIIEGKRRDFSKMDSHVIFIRNNIYKHISLKYKNYHWAQMYVNILCEIALFVSLTLNIDFGKVEDPFSDKKFEIILNEIEDNEENIPKKDLIKRIKNVQGVDLSIIEEFIDNIDRYSGSTALATSTWFKQVENFLKDYDNIKGIEIDQTVNYGYKKLIELIIKQYNNLDTVYGRMINIIPQPMSSGEVALINIFATIYSALMKKTSGSLLLIIDEIDAFLHPKWQQDILTHITRWINESKFFSDKKVQLVLATHSPIILSDIPKDKIIYLKKRFETCLGEQLTFGANISALFYDSFFMEKGSIGAIARKEIQWAIDNIENTNLDLDDRRKLVYIINNIGDKFLRENLKAYPVYIKASIKGRDDL